MAPPRHTVPALVLGAIGLTLAGTAAAANLTYGVLSANHKVKPSDKPSMESKTATLKAARNEFESFQLVLRSVYGPTQELIVSLDGPLQGPSGASIPASQLMLYRQGFYQVGAPSNSEGSSGRWPDPLIPDVDSYYGEKRTAFPMDVPDGETRAVWVDVLVPMDATPGDYEGALSIRIGTQQLGKVAIKLRVGAFTLPSTATLASAYGMSRSAPCKAHTGTDGCEGMGGEERANELRALYLRAGLEHRFTLSDAAFLPPFGASAGPFETWVMPWIEGTGTSRLVGARLTAIRLDGGDTDVGAWIEYAKAKGFADRLYYQPVHEPSTQEQWDGFKSSAQALHGAEPSARVLITSTIQEADKAIGAEEVDIFAPVINWLEGKAGSGQYEGTQTLYYLDWLQAAPNRALWAYQSCMSHGCGACGAATSDPYYTGWPQRVIDSTAVQGRCFPWLAFRLGVTGELYHSATAQLDTAWSAQGQCALSGSGDGTLFYPGKTALIGGSHDIPIESIRMKLIREGMEDFEYLRLIASKDPSKARAVAGALFPSSSQCAQSPGKLESSRDALFAMLDLATDAGVAAGDGGQPDGALDAQQDGAKDAAPDAKDGGEGAIVRAPWEAASGGCACNVRPAVTSGTQGGLLAVLGWLALRRRKNAA